VVFVGARRHELTASRDAITAPQRAPMKAAGRALAPAQAMSPGNSCGNPGHEPEPGGGTRVAPSPNVCQGLAPHRAEPARGTLLATPGADARSPAMATSRSLASLTLSFGLVNVPVNLFTATDSSSGVSFKMLAPDGSRVKQQYVSEKSGKVVERSEMIKGYEFEDDHFVTFDKDELKALDQSASHVIEIVAFVPEKSVDPIYFDKAYFLAPDKRGGKPYALLAEAMRKSGQCALARYALRGKQYVAQVRVMEDGLVLQHLLYADEVRSLKDLNIPSVDISPGELNLALQLIEQIAEDQYDPGQFKDEEKARILEAIDRKIAGKKFVESPRAGETATPSGQVIDLVEALKASLQGPARKSATKESATKESAAKEGSGREGAKARSATVVPAEVLKERKAARRAPKAEEVAEAPAPSPRSRARK
jgi:DNA end-binding protein Ku